MNCHVCGGPTDGATLTVAESMFRTGGEFLYRECSRCRSWNRDPKVGAGSDLYPDEYYSFAVNPMETFASPLARSVASIMARSAVAGRRALLRTIIRCAPIKEMRSLATSLLAVAAAGLRSENPRILDVGSGSGVVPYVLTLAPGVSAKGIDPFATTEISKGRFELRKENLVDVQGHWDLIMFHHSLEHVTNPLQLLTYAKERLSEHGRIVVRVPTPSSWAFEHYGSDWFQFDAPRHEFLATREGLGQLCERAGLKPCEWYDDSSDVQFWMSDTVRSGLAFMDPDSSFAKYRRPTAGLTARIGMQWKARSLNRQMRGDQTCLILECA